MAVGEGSPEPEDDKNSNQPNHWRRELQSPAKKKEESEDEEDEEGQEEEEESRLKYANLTRNLTSLYRNGDTSSAYLVSGDKMIIGTHNGNVHVLSLPMFNTLKYYRAHTISISAISISPFPPPIPTLRPEMVQKLVNELPDDKEKSPSKSPAAKSSPRPGPVPGTSSNQIYIATSSIDGNVCVSSLIDPKDVQLRNFGRPVHSVALSPDYKSDRIYLSGGQEGSLILTTGGQVGKSANAATTGGTAAASSWLGSIGLGTNTGTDKVLHSGEGVISTIRWSLSGKYVLWVNGQGIKIMRSHLDLQGGESNLEWKRISHIDRPNRDGWEEMAGVWKARVEWIDRTKLELDENQSSDMTQPISANGAVSKSETPNRNNKFEEVLVGWGDVVWVIKVFAADPALKVNERNIGRAEVSYFIRFNDCILSGVSLYTPKLLLVLAYMENKDKNTSKKQDEGEKKGRSHRHNALEPELRIIDINTKEEVDTDTLTISRFETLSASDYHLSVLPPNRVPAQLAQRGYLGTFGSGIGAIGSGIGTVGSGLYSGVEAVGQGVWDATMYGPKMLGANRIFSGSDSVKSGTTGGDKPSSIRERNYLTGWIPGLGYSGTAQGEDTAIISTTQGMKIFIYSPYDCIVAIKRNLTDRLQWLVDLRRYEEAWTLLDEHPEIYGVTIEPLESSTPPTPLKSSSAVRSSSVTAQNLVEARQQAALAEFFTDSNSMGSSSKGQQKEKFAAAEKEKGQIAELWLKKLVDAKKWTEAGEIASKVLNKSESWERWIWIFITNAKFDEISPFVPTLEMTPALPPQVFEIILGHYVSEDRVRFKELLDQWPSDLFEISSLTQLIQDQLNSDTVSKESTDWRLLQECLAKLFLADGHYNEALWCYIRLQDADAALSLIKDHHLVGAIADDIPSFMLLRISREQLKSADQEELRDLALEPVKLLVDEADTGVVEPSEVINQLEKASLTLFIFFYLRALWHGDGAAPAQPVHQARRSAAADNLASDHGKLLVEQFADMAVKLFADYDRDLLMTFLHQSTSYTFDKATSICEKKQYIPELVYLLSKTGQIKKALFLIIDKEKDVSRAIAFAKEQDDPGLWDDLLNYSMSRPEFISGLLAEIGTAIDPITLVKRIPSGLEIEGLKDGLKKMIREYDLQDSISTGVAKVLSSEVAIVMEILRRGRRKGIKFDIQNKKPKKVTSMETANAPLQTSDKPSHPVSVNVTHSEPQEISPGTCVGCGKSLHQDESETLVGFACGHVYHVSHLLQDPKAQGDEDTDTAPTLSRGGDESPPMTYPRTIASKVTNARLLKDKIEEAGGCRICKAQKVKLEQV